MNRILKIIHRDKSGYLLFLPFVILYFGIIVKTAGPISLGDQGRYLEFAKNMLHGYYSPPSPNISLHNGPGYPIILIPFVFLKAPFMVIRLMNGILQYLSIVLLFKSARRLVSVQNAFLISIAWGCYYISYQQLALIQTEIVMQFLCSLLIYCVIRAYENRGMGYTIAAGFVFGYIALTKIVFGYVLSIMVILFLILWLIDKTSMYRKRSFLMSAIALCVTLPWLLYTYSMTGKLFYWGSSGGMNLYWMSTPFAGEYGEWNNSDFTTYCHDPVQSCNADYYKKNHQSDYDEIFKNNDVEHEQAYLRLAYKNIAGHPLKYLSNCMANIGRMTFNFPYSYAFQRQDKLYRIPIMAVMITLILYSVIPTVRNWNKTPRPIRLLLICLSLYLSLSALLSAKPEMLTVVVPIILLWIIYTLEKTITMSVKY